MRNAEGLGRVRSRVLTLILADAELEIVPDPILHHPQVTKAARSRDRRARRTVLDASIHHEAIKELPEGERRGRPDLVHFAMLLGLDSALNQAGGLQMVVHTRNDERITVKPETRIMRHYPRFIGLIEKLYQEGQTPWENPLLTLETGWELRHVLEEHASGPIVAFDEAALPVEPVDYFARKRVETEDLTVVLGAFPHGDFRRPPTEWAQEVVGLGGSALSVWTVEMEVLAAWEHASRIFPRPPANAT